MFVVYLYFTQYFSKLRIFKSYGNIYIEAQEVVVTYARKRPNYYELTVKKQ